MADEPATVLGSHGQLEQVFLNLLVHAEQSLSDASEKLITVRSSVVARRILVEIAYSGPKADADPFVAGADEGPAGGLGCLPQSDYRPWRRDPAGTAGGGRSGISSRIALRAAGEAQRPAPENGRDGAHTLTALVIEPAEADSDAVARPAVRAGISRSAGEQFRRRPGPGAAPALRRHLLLGARAWSELGGNRRAGEDARGGIRAAFRFLQRGSVGRFRGERRFVLAKPVDEKQLDRVLDGHPGQAVGSR